jgi:putative tryptophan/tyrosine transport system substrate-binding protein
VKRRDLIAVLGGAAVTAPFSTRAQQKMMRVVGLLIPGTPTPQYAPRLDPSFDDALHQGLKDTGYVEGQNVTLEYRWAEGSL